MKQNQTQNQSWREWPKDHPFALSTDVSHQNPDLFIPRK